MPTPRKSIKTANQSLEKDIFGLENGDIKQDVRSNQVDNKINSIKTNITRGNSSEQVLSVMTDVINGNRRSNKRLSSAENLSRMEKSRELINEVFRTQTDVTEDTERTARYTDYRLIDKYIPEITDSLDVLRDSIMSPDDISKKSVLYSYIGELSTADRELFESNMRKLFEKYDFETFISDKIRSTLLLGDGFTIVDKLSSTFTRYLNEGDGEDEELKDDGNVLSESADIFASPKFRDRIKAYYEKAKSLNEASFVTKGSDGKKYQVTSDMYVKNTEEEILKMINKNVKYIEDPMKALSDFTKYTGSTVSDKYTDKITKELNINGVYFKDLNPDDVIKLEIDHICIGYIVINRTRGAADTIGGFGSGGINSNYSMLGAITSALNPDMGNANNNLQFNQASMSTDAFTGNQNVLKDGNTALAYNTIVDMLVKGISEKIDNKYIEKNEAFRDLLFGLVRMDYIISKEIDITFLEASQLDHVKIDSTMTYGVSRIASSMFPAKLYLALLLTNLMLKINQGRDRRVFYVDTDLDDDFEGNIEQIIKDVKSSEIPTSSFGSTTSVSTVLNTVGSLENYYIPTIDGNRPFDIDVISGMQVDINDELMEKLLKSAIIGTGVPYNYIDATNEIDFARSLSMQNQGFVKKVVNYQQVFSRFFTKIIRKMYKYEFGIDDIDETKNNKLKEIKIKNKKRGKKSKKDDDADSHSSMIDIEKIEIVFPEPVLLNVTTNNEQIEATNTTIEYITEMYVDANDENADDIKRRFKKELARSVYMKNLDWEAIDKAYDKMQEDSIEEKLLEKISKASQGSGEEGTDGAGSEDDGGGGSFSF